MRYRLKSGVLLIHQVFEQSSLYNSLAITATIIINIILSRCLRVISVIVSTRFGQHVIHIQLGQISLCSYVLQICNRRWNRLLLLRINGAIFVIVWYSAPNLVKPGYAWHIYSLEGTSLARLGRSSRRNSSCWSNRELCMGLVNQRGHHSAE